MQGFYRFVEDHADSYQRELQELLREPSIFTNTIGISSTVAMLEGMLERAGCRVTRLSVGDSKPYLYAEAGDEGPTVLFYNHYDVQPVEPLSQWEFGPFLAEIRDGYLYARGAADSKGNLYARIAAVSAYLKIKHKLPCRVKFLLDGEEEVGSPHMEELVRQHPDIIQADLCVWESGLVDQKGRLGLSFGIKGLAYLELRCRTMQSDIHSSWAAIVENPAWRLIHAMASMRALDGTITIDGLLQLVVAPEESELALVKGIDIDLDFFRELYNFKSFIGPEDTISLVHRYIFNPTCNICGFHSGYAKTETKTVLPHEAWANMDFRLVPDMTPERVGELLRNHLDRRGFQDVEIKLKCGMSGYRKQPPAEVVDAICRSVSETFHAEPLCLPMLAASGPMHQICGRDRLPVVSFGIAHPGSHIHAPNENIRIHDFICGIKFVGRLLDQLGGAIRPV